MYFKWIVMFFAELLMFIDFPTKRTRSKKYGKPHIPWGCFFLLHHLIELPNWVLSMVICVWHIEPPTAPVPALAHVAGLKNFITKPHSHKSTGGQFGGIKPKILRFFVDNGGISTFCLSSILKKNSKEFWCWICCSAWKPFTVEMFFSTKSGVPKHDWSCCGCTWDIDKTAVFALLGFFLKSQFLPLHHPSTSIINHHHSPEKSVFNPSYPSYFI